MIANYPIHGTVLGANLEISGDVPGVVSEYVEEKFGVPLLFINGAEGNIAPIYSGSGSGRINQFKVLLGDKILDAASRKITSSTDKIKLYTGSMVVETPRKEGLGWSTDLIKYSKSGNGKEPNMVRMPVRFLKINEEIAIWSAPIELFCEVSNEIRERSPFPIHSILESQMELLVVTNSFAWEQGGYETTVSPFTPMAAKDLTEAVLGYLHGEMLSNH